MKEVRFFYVPDALNTNELPEEEASHAVRVLRLAEGDDIVLMDGKGVYHNAVVTETNKRHCYYKIVSSEQHPKEWTNRVHIAVAPTKNIDRIEWFAEKATEIGVDEMTFLNCRFSERRNIKIERIEKIVISAMKQSHKSVMPVLNDIVKFDEFVKQPFSCAKYICHCYDEPDLDEKVLLHDVLAKTPDAVVLVGPEGDFSIDEVKLALDNGFKSVSLGKSRLRTETAALVAVHLMHLC
jgi:16S rRNA (uracil1498-N3)-methyltransferase